MNSILSLSSMIFPLISFPYVSRILQPAGTGKVSFAVSVVSYFSMFAMMGIPTYGIRACAQVRDDKEKLSRTVQEILIINFFLGILTYLVFAASLVLVPRFRIDSSLFCVVGLTIGFNIIGVEWLYQALEQYAYIAVRSVAFKAIAMLLMFLMIRSPEDYVTYGALTILASVGSNLLNFVNLRKLVSFRFQGPYDFKRHVRPILVFFCMSVATTIYTNLDQVMLGFMRGDEQVGLYTAAVKVKNMLVSLVTSLGAVLLPRVSFYVETKQQEAFERVTKLAFRFVVILAIPLTLYFILYAEPVILLLAGVEFQEATLAMQIIMPTVLLIGMTNVMGIQILLPMGKELWVLSSECAGAVVDLILNLLLIPFMGAAGAAVGTLAAEMVVFLVQYLHLKKLWNRTMWELPWRLILMANIIAFLPTYGIRLLGQSIWMILPLSFGCLIGVYLVVLILGREELVLRGLKEWREKLGGTRKK